MSKKKIIKVVIGANFGDEGKGLMTDYFCHDLVKKGKSVLNIRHNGGANAAHNVVTPDGKHHTFSHFGAGSFNEGVTTYLAEDFILNPILFCRELEELEKLGVRPKVYIHPWCRITTPYDMILNQMIEKRRGENRHGSCGVGIDETIRRYKKPEWNIYFQNIKYFDKICLKEIRRKYTMPRIHSLNLFNITEEEKDQLNNSQIIDNYLTQLDKMADYCQVEDSTVLNDYGFLVFEGAQGLLLDQDYLPFAPHLTSSRTGSYNPKKMLLEHGLQNEDIEFCYVTRSYFTRHGAGPFPTECSSEELFDEERIEKHNPENEFQGKFRYGYFDQTLFYTMLNCDCNNMICAFPNAKPTVAITHLDDTGNEIICTSHTVKPENIKFFKYCSYGETRDYIVKY